MAVWQFKFSLVPTSGIVGEHGRLVVVLPEYGSSQSSSSADDAEDAHFVNYWEKAGMTPASLQSLMELLPSTESWSDEARMFGEAEGDRIEVWEDDINCALDLRTFSKDLLQAIVQIASRAQCKLVLHGTGEVIEPELPVVLDKILASNAYLFCIGPTKFLRGTQR